MVRIRTKPYLVDANHFHTDMRIERCYREVNWILCNFKHVRINCAPPLATGWRAHECSVSDAFNAHVTPPRVGRVSYARKGRRGLTLTLIPKLHVRYTAAGGIPRDCIDISKYGVTVRTDTSVFYGSALETISDMWRTAWCTSCNKTYHQSFRVHIISQGSREGKG